MNLNMGSGIHGVVYSPVHTESTNTPTQVTGSNMSWSLSYKLLGTKVFRVVQVALAVVLTYQLFALWQGSQCSKESMRGRRHDISTQIGCSSPICKLRFCIGRSKGAGSKGEPATKSGMFPHFTKQTSETQVTLSPQNLSYWLARLM